MSGSKVPNLSLSSINVIYDVSNLEEPTSKRRKILHDGKPPSSTTDLTASISICSNCSKFDIASLMARSKDSESHRTKVGNLKSILSTRHLCRFCNFISETYDLKYQESIDEGKAPLNKDSTDVYLSRDQNQEPWFSILSFDSGSPSCAFLWVEFGLPQEDDESRVCLNFIPQLCNNPGCERTIAPRLRPQLTEKSGHLDFGLLKHWMQACREHHADSCGRKMILEGQASNLFVIDIKERYLRQVSTEHRYVALSYVWGPESRRVKNGWRWPEESSLTNEAASRIILPDTLPKTIEDAMRVTSALGEQYLWVDAFCINQHDPKHLAEQTNIMDIIYKCATVTIIAFDGGDSQAGLAGVSRPMAQMIQPKVETSAGVLVATYLQSVKWEPGISEWDRRGWTMQEYLLSRRCIVIDRNQVLWKCQQEYLHDCLPVDLSDDPPRFEKDDKSFRYNCDSVDVNFPEWSFAPFSCFLSVYSGRSLTFQSDALKACQGILNHISNLTGMKWIQGLPCGHLLPSLLWNPHPEHCLQRRSGFPSWSWLGWNTRIEYNWWLHDKEALHQIQLTLQLPYSMTSRSGSLRWTNGSHSFDGSDSISDSAIVPQYEAIQKLYKNLKGKNPITYEPKVHVQQWKTNENKLCISSRIAKFQVRLVRRQVGDHWTLLDKHGNPIKNPIGEQTYFEETDYFFRLDPQMSRMVIERHNEVHLVFIKFYDVIRDNKEDENFAVDIVTALVVLPEPNDEWIRIASVALPLKYWMLATKEKSLIQIV